MTGMREIERDIDSWIDGHLEEYGELSDWMAANPELGGEERKASSRIAGMLDEAGFKVTYPYLGIPTAFLGAFGGGGPVVDFLVEYDALPEIGHACGHNLHGAMSVLAGTALAKNLGRGGAEIRIVGTPAEETDGAKVAMADAGIFDDVDIALMFHINAGYTSPAYRALAVCCYEFEFKGKAAHASSSPWEGRNALNGVQLFFHALDMLRQHVRSGLQIHGIVKNGGAAPNIVPESASALFYFRAPWKEYLAGEMEKIFNCARGAALATGTEASWQAREASFDNMLPNEAAEGEMGRILGELGVPVKINLEPDGSSDVGNVSWRCPTLQGEFDVADGRKIVHHTREFAQIVSGGEQTRRCLAKGAKALARMGLRVIRDEALRSRIRDDFREAREREKQRGELPC
ncbi:MAG: amidohydrolase [Synergistaceae bacterium]|jgi:amidohydrolase|nr:amidohydrolase [Synergistaceae bacterium]